MNMHPAAVRRVSQPLGRWPREAFRKLVDANRQVDELRSTIYELAGLTEDQISARLRKVARRLDDIETPITLVGQVKAGKTSLVNAIIGQAELLPADVNPWTSVVTSIHLNHSRKQDDPRALFHMFEQQDWDALVQNGGRMGELSERAGAKGELEKVRRQVEEMQEKTRSRLGKRFELLLGQTHEYKAFDHQLIEKYVCLGDDFELDDDDDAEHQGTFADITRAAELFLDAPDIPARLTLRDTPGVNDTFMMREQITINAIRKSRMTVIVLSAHQALTTTDMALIRLMSNVDQKDLIIFVNRIDELTDPARSVPEIRESITKTLAAKNGPATAKIIFGSAYWANIAAHGRFDEIPSDSAASLMNWAKALDLDMGSGMPLERLVMELSGVPGLFAALSERIASGPIAEAMEKARREARNITDVLLATTGPAIDVQSGHVQMSKAEVKTRLSSLGRSTYDDLKGRLKVSHAALTKRTNQSHERFLDRALDALISHLEENGDNEAWTYNADGLRGLLRSGYARYSAAITVDTSEVLEKAAKDISVLYKDVLGIDLNASAIRPPKPQKPAPPVTISRTIVLDMERSWWQSWWQRRRGYRAFADNFIELIRSETTPLAHDLCQDQAIAAGKDNLKLLKEFLDDQFAQFLSLCREGNVSADQVKQALGLAESEEKANLIVGLVAEL